MENKSLATTSQQSNPVERFKELASSKKVREMNHEELEVFCLKTILQAFFNSGSKPVPDDDMRLLIHELYNDLRNDHAGVSIDDIHEAIRRGSKGQYGEVFGVNPKAWGGWISAYLKNGTRLLALKNLEEKKQPEDLSEEQQRKIKLEWIDTLDQIFRSRKSIINHMSIGYIYQTLLDAKLIDADFTQLREDAEEMVNEFEKKKIRRAERAKPGSKEWEIEVIRTCKAFRVSIAFNKMHAAKFDLKQYLIENLERR